MGQEGKAFPVCAGSRVSFPKGMLGGGSLGGLIFLSPPPGTNVPKGGLPISLIFSTVLRSCVSDEPSNGLHRRKSLSASSVCSEQGKEELELVFQNSDKTTFNSFLLISSV